LEAGQSNISENVLVKQILTNYVDWARLSNGTGLLSITKNCFKKLSKNLDVESIQDLVGDIHSLIKNFAMIKYGHYDQNGAIELLSMYLSMSNFSLVHLKEGMVHRFLVTHNLGIGFSLILEQLFKNIFSEFNDPSKMRFITSDDSIIASEISD